MDPDHELVERARTGDLAAFERLVEGHRDIVFRVVARIVEAGEPRTSPTMRTRARAAEARAPSPAPAERPGRGDIIP
jgi:hypothetical protein